MGRKKAVKIKEVSTFPNVFQARDEHLSKKLFDYLNNHGTISLEVGCGDGEYTIALARQFPERNFIGIDIKSSRIYKGSKIALEEKISNAAFITGRFEKIAEIFKETKVEEIIIPFPDPHVRRKSAPRRLMSDAFLEIYKSILNPNGSVHFKTDNAELFEFGVNNLVNKDVEILHINRNVHASENKTIIESITTRYERHYVAEGRTIHYVKFRFK